MTAAEAVAWARAGSGISATAAQTAPARSIAPRNPAPNGARHLTFASWLRPPVRHDCLVRCELTIVYRYAITDHYRPSRRAFKQPGGSNNPLR
jgi:hypothetical protein